MDDGLEPVCRDAGARDDLRPTAKRGGAPECIHEADIVQLTRMAERADYPHTRDGRAQFPRVIIQQPDAPVRRRLSSVDVIDEIEDVDRRPGRTQDDEIDHALS